MPELNGHEALKAIRDKEKSMDVKACDGVKAIMMTGVVDTQNVMEAFMEGCEAYLVKPVQKDKLLKQIRDLGLTH